MGEYRWIANIKYNESRFKILSDNNLQKFYLKILDDNSLMYPTLEEFKELNGIFNQDINMKFYDMNSKSENENISNNKNKKKYSFIPKVIYKGALISLASALVLIGSANEINSHFESERLKEMTDIQILKEYNYEVEEITDDILIPKIVPDCEGKKLIFCKTTEEFKQYLDVKNPTFRDLKETVQENENIGDRYKEWLYAGIENLEASNINMDLSTLYYNLERMKVIEASAEEISDHKNNKYVIAYFNSDTSSVVINPTTVSEYTFYHEALGHAMTECVIDKKNEKIFKSFRLRILNSLDREDYKKIKVPINSVGDGVKEGIADVIASIASNKSVKEGHYDMESAQLLIFKDALGIDYKNLIDNGVYGIFNNMLDSGMNSSLEYIDNIDALNSAHIQGNLEIDDSITLQENVEEFFFYLAKAKIEKGESKDDVINNICSVLDNSEIKMIPKGSFIPYNGYMSQVDFTSMTLIRDEIINNIKDYEKDKDTVYEEEIRE